MYLKTSVAIPQVPGKIITKSKGGSVYVLFQYGRKYVPEKRYAIPLRAVIGKVVPGNRDRILPNERFQEFFPEIPVSDELPDNVRSCALRIGAYIVMRKILEEYSLQPLLAAQFQEDCGLLLDLAAYLIVEEENAGQHYPDFAFSHPLFSSGMHIFSDSKVCRFLQSVSREQIIGFLASWNRKRDHKQRIYISYDSTNKNCQAGDIDIVEFGKPKDDEGVPVFNIGLAFDKTNSVPLFYEEYLGSINDVSQFQYMVDKVREYKYKQIGFVLDRGYFSKDNIRYMEENGFSFIIMVKGCRKLVSRLVAEHRNTFETDRDCLVRAYRVYGKTVKARLYEDDTQERFFHLFYNSARQAAERQQLEQLLSRLETFLDKHVGTAVTLGKSYQEFFCLRYSKDNILLSYSEKKEAIRARLEQCGYFAIITSERMTAPQALIQYKGRDISEKLFGADKSFLGSRSIRVQSNDSLSAKLFIEFIALIIRNRFYNLLKETMLRLEEKPNYLTVPAALRELEKIEMVRRNNGRYMLDHAVTRKQKTILSAFGMSEEDVRKAAADIANLLAESKSLMDETDGGNDKEDCEDGTDESNICD